MLKDHKLTLGAPPGSAGLRFIISVMPVETYDAGRDLERADGTTTRLMNTIDVSDAVHGQAASMLELIREALAAHVTDRQPNN